MIFKDRKDAGEKLAEKLKKYKNDPNAIVIGLPRGGVVVAFYVAQKLNLPLDIIVSKKITPPQEPELAIGAVNDLGETILDQNLISLLNVSPEYLKKELEIKQKEARRRLNLYRPNLSPLNLKNKTIIIVDDGIATGSTMEMAIKTAKKNGAKKIIVAVPMSAQDAIEKLKKEISEIICLDIPTSFMGIGQFYENFAQTSDDQVIELMKRGK